MQSPSTRNLKIRGKQNLIEELKIIIKAEIDKLKEELQEAREQVKETEKQAQKSGKGIGSALSAAGKAVGTACKAMVGAVVAVGTAIVGVTEATREYRTQQALLASSFQTAGGNAEIAKETFNDLYRVLGDTGQATEAAQHLAQLTTEEQALSEWTTICQGVYATFGDSLPIESLTEAANETAKTGEVTGALADALNWAGISEQEFADTLFMMNSEAEREAYIRETLTGIYGNAAAAYEQNAKAVLDANEAQLELLNTTAQVGSILEPVVTTFKQGLTTALQGLLPGFEMFTQGFTDMILGVEGGAELMKQGIDSLVKSAIETITSAIPMILQMGLDIITALLEGIAAAIPDLLQTVADIIPQIITVIGELTPLVTGVILNSLPLIITAILDAVAQILITLGDVIPDILQQIIAILPMIVDSIVDAIPTLLDAAVTFLMAIVDAIPVIVTELVEALPVIIESILEAVTEAIPQLLEAAITLLMAVVDAIPLILPPLIDAIPLIINSIIDFLIDNIPVLISGAIELFMALVTAIPKIIPQLITQLGSIVSTINSTLTSRLGDIFKGMWNGLVAGGKSALDGIKNVFKSIPTWFKDIFSSAWKAVKNVFSSGGKVFDGIKDGILDGLKGVVNGLIGGINKVIAVPFNGINSALGKIKGISIAGVKPFDWMPTISVPQIPKLAKGGVIDTATLAMIGEAGKEAVVPLENNTEWMDSIIRKLIEALDGSDRPIILQVDGKTFARTSIKSINQLTKQTGKLDLILA